MYNSLSALPSIGYNIATYLATSPDAENLWKMLKYNDYDALNKDNLTIDEKLDFLWKAGPQEKFGVFFTNLIEDAIIDSKCVLKIYNYYDAPNELYTANVVYAFDFLYGGQMSLVEYNGIPVSRGDLFISTILSVLNGAVVGGVGKLTWLDDMSRYCAAKSVVGNERTFTGVQLFMGVMVGDTGKKDGCHAGY